MCDGTVHTCVVCVQAHTLIVASLASKTASEMSKVQCLILCCCLATFLGSDWVVHCMPKIKLKMEPVQMM